MGFEYLKDEDSTASQTTCSSVNHPRCTKTFCYVQTEFLVFQFMPNASCLFIEYHWEETAYILITASHQLFIEIEQVPC